MIELIFFAEKFCTFLCVEEVDRNQSSAVAQLAILRNMIALQGLFSSDLITTTGYDHLKYFSSGVVEMYFSNKSLHEN